MTRKHFVMLAALMADLRAGGDRWKGHEAAWDAYNAGLDCAVKALADVLCSDNPRFDRARFLRSCGVRR